jgi:hypothetical protein
MRTTTLFLLALTFCTIGPQCQYPTKENGLPNAQQFLIIDAELTPNYGKVKVSYSITGLSPQGGYTLPPDPVASVYVEDSQGVQYFFDPKGKMDTNFKGQIGETYQLFVEADGQFYTSDKETMRACPVIDSLAAFFNPEAFRNQEDDLYYGFDIYAFLTDTPGTEDFYQWDWTHNRRTEHCAEETINYIPHRIPCTPYDCWGIYRNAQVITQSDKLRDGVTIAKKITRIPFTSPPNRYYLSVEQRAVTANVYEYLKSQEVQNQNTGSIFDIPAQTRLNPNVRNVDNPSEKILGSFNVFSSQKSIIIVDMTKEINGIRAKPKPDLKPWHPDPLLQAPCIESSNRTLIRPDGWVD